MSIKQIAEMAGVSMSTAARVLRNPEYKCSSEEVRQRILRAAREINYVPNEAARRLKSGAPSEHEVYIDLLLTRELSENNDPFFSEVLRTAEIEIRKSGCIVANVWYCKDFYDDKLCGGENVERIVDNMYKNKSHSSDGLIIIGKCCSRALKSLKNHEKNIVSVNRSSENSQVDEVVCDGRKIAVTAISYLVKCGHTKIGYVGNCHNEARFAGYQAAQVQFSLESDIDFVFDTTPGEENGIKAMEYFLNLQNPPTGIYCANDILAIGMLKCLRKRRSRYYSPSIVSSDDIEESQYTKPMLTTVSLPKAEMVRLAIMLLLDRIRGGHKSISRLEMNSTLVIRESCIPIEQMQEPEYYI